MSEKYKDSHSLWISVFSNLKRKKKLDANKCVWLGGKKEEGIKERGI